MVNEIDFIDGATKRDTEMFVPQGAKPLRTMPFCNVVSVFALPPGHN